jgi:ERCC4-type nuclease
LQQFLEGPERDRIKIIIDHRESEFFDRYLEEAGAIVKRQNLELGDFICSSKLVVERKTRADFESSIIDGRLFNQLQDLSANYPSVVLVVEGTKKDAPERLRKEAILGAYATAISDFGVSLIFTRSMESTAELVYSFAKHEQMARGHPLRVFAKRKTLTPSQTQRSVIEMLPMVGPKLAKELLVYFGSVENIVNASQKELESVPGLGKKRAKVIKSLLKYRYDLEEDEVKFY